METKKNEIICCICGKKEDASRWIDSVGKTLTEHQMCFECNHWRENHELDITERKEHCYAIVDGVHYVLYPASEGNTFVKGFGGARFKFEFFDGTVVECDNVWCQGDISKAHPYWHKLMPDNARIIVDKSGDNSFLPF